MGPYRPHVRQKYPPLMGLEAISDSPAGLGFAHRGGPCRREKARFFSRLVEGLEIWNDLWTEDGTLSSRRGAGSTYKAQPIRGRPVGLGFLHRAGRNQPG